MRVRIAGLAGCGSRGRVAVLVAGGDHQQEAQHLGQAAADAFVRARIVDARGETSGHAEPVLDLTHRQKAAIG